jgi:hypothetical protein
MTSNEEKSRIHDRLTESLAKAAARDDLAVAKLAPDPYKAGLVWVDVNVPPDANHGFRVCQIPVETSTVGLGGGGVVSAYRPDVVEIIEKSWPLDFKPFLK